MSTWIAWPPDEPETKFPDSYWEGDPLQKYQEGIDKEECPACGFTVQFISDKHQYENWNGHSHDFVAGILEVQRNIGDCPSHPKPSWMV